jgi:hypothetical protein
VPKPAVLPRASLNTSSSNSNCGGCGGNGGSDGRVVLLVAVLVLTIAGIAHLVSVGIANGYGLDDQGGRKFESR